MNGIDLVVKLIWRCKFNRYFLILNLFLMVFILLSDSTALSAVTIVKAHRPKAIIILPHSPTSQTRTSAEFLANYIYESTGAKLPIIDESDLIKKDSGVRIWIGSSNYVSKQKISFNKMGNDGFTITFPDLQNIIILGNTDWGTEFGVCEFLERFVGVRWLLPGTVGQHIPKHTTLTINRVEVIQSPAFVSRLMSGLRGEAQSAWARHNRMHGTINFHHNLIRLFPASAYKDSHPEFFPIINGKRHFPANDKDHRWQPCFSAPGLVDEAVRHVSAYFDKNPDEISYSLGVNDGNKYFCQCDKCITRIGSRKNYLNLPDYSHLYYDWASKVAEGVLKKHPNKWFGCLAYNQVAEPPEIKLHPRIVPFMTYDRMKWIDSVTERQGKDLTERWANQASQIGWYDYIYGTPYLVPRVYFHKMAAYYRYAHQHGVRAMYAEAYPNWGEGPKLYIALKLQWDPYADVDALLKEWYVAAVGSTAAADLAAYYELWENFWSERVKETSWFTSSKGQYLNHNSPGYLELVTFDDIQTSRRLLEAVVAKTETPEQKARGHLIFRTFEYYEASVLAYLGLVKNIRQPGKSRKYYEEYEKKRRILINEFQNNAILMHPSRFDDKKRKQLMFH